MKQRTNSYRNLFQGHTKIALPSTDVIQLTWTLKMTTTQVFKTSVTVNNNSPIQDYVHPHDQTQPTFEGFITFVASTVVGGPPDFK